MCNGNLHASWLALPAVGLVIVSVLVITLVMVLIGNRGRAIASVFLALGLLMFFLLAVSLLVPRYFARTANVDRQLVQAEMALAREPFAERGTVEPFHLVKLDDTSDPPKPADDEKKPKAESRKAAAEKAESDQPAPDDNRPDWVDAKPFKDGGVYKVPLTVGPWPTSDEAMKRLPAVVDKEISKYAVSRAGHGAAAKTKLPIDYVMAHMIKDDRWEEAVKINSFDDVKHMVGRDVWENSANAADGQWSQLHLLLKFDDEVNRRLDDAWAGQSRVERLLGAGALGAIAMIILTAVYSYLKIDLKTGGAYRGRLRAGALAAILAVIVAVLLSHS